MISLGVFYNSLFGAWLGKGLVYFTGLNIFLILVYSFNKLFLSNDIFYLVINLWIQVEKLVINREILLNSLNISVSYLAFFIANKLGNFLNLVVYIYFLIFSLKLTGIPFCIFAFCSDEILDPQIEHLVWFLNLPVFQKEFESIIIGSAILILVFSVFFSRGAKMTIKNKGGMEKFFSMLPGFLLLIITVPTYNGLYNLEELGFPDSYFSYMRDNYPELVSSKMELTSSVNVSYQQVNHFVLAVPKQGHDIYYGKCCLIGDVVHTFSSTNPTYVVLRTAQILDMRSPMKPLVELPSEILLTGLSSLLDTVIFVTLDTLFINVFKATLGTFDSRSNLFMDETGFQELNMLIEQLTRWGVKWAVKGKGFITESEYSRFFIQEYLRDIIDGIFSMEKALQNKNIKYPPYSKLRLPKMTLTGFARYDFDPKTGKILFTHPDGTTSVVERPSPYTGFQLYDQHGKCFEYSDDMHEWRKDPSRFPKVVSTGPCPKLEPLRGLLKYSDPVEQAKSKSKKILSYIVWGTILCGATCYTIFEKAQPLLGLVFN